MKIFKILFGLLVVVGLVACGNKSATDAKNGAIATADNSLTIDMQVNVAQPDGSNYVTFSGPLGGVEKDTFDTTTAASAKKATEAIAHYMIDVEKKTSMPYGVRSLLLFPVAENTRLADGLTAISGSDGAITVMYAHRGTAYRMKTDTSGSLTVPGATIEMRKIGSTDQIFPNIFAKDTTINTLDWAKVWDSTVTAEGVGGVVKDEPTSTMVKWGGTLNFSLNNNILKVQGKLQPSV